MKTLNKKNLFVVILTFIFALSMFVFAGTATVFADEQTVTETGVFEMVKGASIRIGQEDVDNDSGIRFKVKMSTDVYDDIVTNDSENNVKLGFIITTKEIFDDRTITTDADTGLEIPDYINSIGLYVNKNEGGIMVHEGDAERANTIYHKDGYYWAQAAVINVSDVNREYVAIAYYVENDTYTYATFDNTLSRSIIVTASKVYLNGDETVETLRKSEDLGNFAQQDNPALISDSDDVYALSDSVNNKQKTFDVENPEGENTPAYIKLNADVAVDWDFDQIEENFNGAFVSSDKRITAVNNPEITHIFANMPTDNPETEEDGVVVNDDVTTYKGVAFTKIDSLLTVTDRVADRVKTGNTSSDSEFMTNSKLPKTVFNDGSTVVAGATSFSGNAIKSPVGNETVYITMNYTATELESKKDEYNAVRFKYLLESNSGSISNNTSELGLANVITTRSKQDGGLNRSFLFDQNSWRSHLVEIDDFITAMRAGDSDERTVFFTQFWFKTVDANIYFADFELVNDYTTIYSAEINPTYLSMGTIKYTVDETDSTQYSAAWTGSSGTAAKEQYLANDQLPTDYSGTYPTNDVISKVVAENNIAGYVNLRYNADEIEKIAEVVVDSETQQKYYRKYSDIEITLAVATAWGAGTNSDGVLTSFINDKKISTKTWVTLTVDVGTFVTYVGKNVSYFNTTSGVVAVPDDYLLLNFNTSTQVSAGTLYIANISFVEAAS